MIQRIFITLITVGLLFLTSCTTYYISVDSLTKQFSGIDSTKLKKVQLSSAGLMYLNGVEYLANPISNIECTDKNGNPAKLKNSPSIEMRITYGEKNKRTVFYFDRTLINDSSLVGVESRFVSSIKKQIPLNSIKKIEVQDGGKNWKYGNVQ